jgi:hypothetical protein
MYLELENGEPLLLCIQHFEEGKFPEECTIVKVRDIITERLIKELEDRVHIIEG